MARFGGPQPGAGRPKGARNKITTTAKENMLAVFESLGGTKGMAEWARSNQSDYYKIYARLVPQQVDIEANVRNCDVTSKPLTAEEWQERFGQH